MDDIQNGKSERHALVAEKNLHLRVVRNSGADGMTVEELQPYLMGTIGNSERIYGRLVQAKAREAFRDTEVGWGKRLLGLPT